MRNMNSNQRTNELENWTKHPSSASSPLLGFWIWRKRELRRCTQADRNHPFSLLNLSVLSPIIRNKGKTTAHSSGLRTSNKSGCCVYRSSKLFTMMSGTDLGQDRPVMNLQRNLPKIQKTTCSFVWLLEGWALLARLLVLQKVDSIQSNPTVCFSLVFWPQKYVVPTPWQLSQVDLPSKSRNPSDQAKWPFLQTTFDVVGHRLDTILQVCDCLSLKAFLFAFQKTLLDSLTNQHVTCLKMNLHSLSFS